MDMRTLLREPQYPLAKTIEDIHVQNSNTGSMLGLQGLDSGGRYGQLGTWQMPRLVAKMTMGARLLSRARFRYVKHSMSSMCTCNDTVFLVRPAQRGCQQ